MVARGQRNNHSPASTEGLHRIQARRPAGLPAPLRTHPGIGASARGGLGDRRTHCPRARNHCARGFLGGAAVEGRYREAWRCARADRGSLESAERQCRPWFPGRRAYRLGSQDRSPLPARICRIAGRHGPRRHRGNSLSRSGGRMARPVAARGTVGAAAVRDSGRSLAANRFGRCGSRYPAHKCGHRPAAAWVRRHRRFPGVCLAARDIATGPHDQNHDPVGVGQDRNRNSLGEPPGRDRRNGPGVADIPRKRRREGETEARAGCKGTRRARGKTPRHGGIGRPFRGPDEGHCRIGYRRGGPDAGGRHQDGRHGRGKQQSVGGRGVGLARGFGECGDGGDLSGAADRIDRRNRPPGGTVRRYRRARRGPGEAHRRHGPRPVGNRRTDRRSSAPYQ